VKHPALVLMLPLALAACQPTVKLEAPDKPIEINLNVKIQQEVRVSIAKDLDKAIKSDPSLF
jgi:YnbE-like lipoprotein